MKTLKEMPKVTRTGRTAKYPFATWFEAAEKGAGVELFEGDDFECEVKTMRHNLYRHSKINGLDITTVILEDEENDTKSIALSVNTPEEEDTTTEDTTTKKDTSTKK